MEFLDADLYSPEHFNKKMRERMAKLKPEDFEPWDEARERYIHERIEPIHDTYRQTDHNWFKDFCRRSGEAMHHSDLIFRIQKLNPNIFVQQQINFPDDWGLYAESLGRVRLLTGLPKGWLTEFSYSMVDERDLPVEERRGWRTVLIYCLMKGALTWDQVVHEFGEPGDGFNEERWMNVTESFRHGGDEVVQRNIANALE